MILLLALAFLAWLTIDWPASRTARMLAGYAIRKAASLGRKAGRAGWDKMKGRTL